MIIKTMDASFVRKCFLAGANAIDAKKEVINDLNVFPVPDGDTGTNMTMTIMSAAKEVAALENPDMKSLGKAISRWFFTWCKRKLRCYFVAITPWIHERSVKG